MYRSFGFWLSAVFITSIVAPLLIFYMLFAAYFNNIYAMDTDQMFANTLYSLSQSITVYLDDLGRISMMPYYHSEIMGYFVDINDGRYFSDPVATVRVNKEYQLSISQQLTNSRSDVIGIIFVPYNNVKNCGFLVRRYSDKLEVLPNFNADNTDWYKSTLAADGRIFFPSIGEAEYYQAPQDTNFSTVATGNIFSIARLIKDPNTMRPIGIIRVDAVDMVIADIFRHISTEPSSSLMLLDQNNTVVYTTKQMPAQLIQSVSPDTRKVSGEDDSYLVSIYPVASTPWRLLYFASEKGLQTKAVSFYVTAIIWGIVCMGIVAVLFYFNSRYAVYSEKQILAAMRRISSGDLNVNLTLRKGSYYATIAQALNQTAEKLNTHITNEYKAVLNQRNTKYIALQTQINPHFLYNILSGFVTLNRLGEKETLESSILTLSHMFRYTCNNENISTMEGELTFLEQYLALQKLRFDDRLHYSIVCTEAARKVVIPRLLLQPLAENSIIHGMEPNNDSIHITVTADIIPSEDKSSQLQIVLYDDGAGFDSNEPKKRVGLANIAERLELFSADAVFQIESSPGKGCKCIILLPIMSEAKV